MGHIQVGNGESFSLPEQKGETQLSLHWVTQFPCRIPS